VERVFKITDNGGGLALVRDSEPTSLEPFTKLVGRMNFPNLKTSIRQAYGYGQLFGGFSLDYFDFNLFFDQKSIPI